MTTIASDLPNRSPSISGGITFLLALSCGLIVANIYYAQPLVGPIAAELGLSPKAAGLVMTMTQLGCLHDLPLRVMATHRSFRVASATHTFHPGASTPGNSGSRPLRFLPWNLGPRVKVRYFRSGDQVM